MGVALSWLRALSAAILRQITDSALKAITAAWGPNASPTCDEAIALLREIADLETDDDGDVILGADANGRNDLLPRIAALLADHDRQ